MNDRPTPQATLQGQLPPLPSLGARSRTRSEVFRLRALAAVLGLLWLAGLTLQLGLRPDHHELPPFYAYGLPALMYLSGMILLGMAVSRGRSGAGPRPRRTRAAIAGLLALFVLSAFWREVGTHSMILEDAKVAWMAHAMCGTTTLLLGVVPFVLAVMALRHAFPVHATARGALVGLCCGLAASASIHLHCPVTETSHILLSHGGPLFALTLIGAFVGSRWLRT